MDSKFDGLISYVIPAYNEALGLNDFHDSLLKVVESLANPYEIIYCDDGSADNTAEIVRNWNEKDSKVKLVKLSRNFGKEAALAAGITIASGKAIILIDADGQHPVELIPEFISRWKAGAEVVTGIRLSYQGEGIFKRSSSKIFYKLFNKLSEMPLMPGSTDYRLISRTVADAFLELKEGNRMTRALIDWLGFKQSYIEFKANNRLQGDVSYSNKKLFKLAANSFVSLTSTPIYLFGYLGIFITAFSSLLGAAIVLEQLILNDPFNWNFTGTAMLGVLIIFLVGIVLLSQGILALYISHINVQSKQRPLFVLDYESSAGITKPKL